MIKKFLGLVLLLVANLAFAVPAAYVHEMTGTATAATKGQSRTLAVGGLLESGDVLSVAKGVLTVKFEDGQVVVLQENSRFAIENYSYNKAKVADSNVVMSLLSGSMRFITGVIGGTRRDAIALRAGTATIGIRGTDLAVSLAGTEYVVTVQNGNVVLTANNTSVSVNQGQGSTGQTNQAPRPSVPVTQLPPRVVTLVAAVTGTETPGTNPVGVQQQSALVAAVKKATDAAKEAQAPTATQAQKDAAASAAREVQTAITSALQATQTAIQQALSAGASATSAKGEAPKQGSAPGLAPAPATKSEAQKAVETVNQNLPPAQQLNPTQIQQLEQQIQTSTPTATPTATPTLTQDQQTTLEQQSQLLQTLTTQPTAPPTTCGGTGQSPC